MDHRKAKRISYHNGIRDFRSFGQSETQKLSSVQLQFCPETEISSEVDLQNSVISKTFGGQSHMSNGWKAGRVVHILGAQLQDRIVTKQSRFHFFLMAVHIDPEI
jgi:hypothetical protein